LTLAVDISNYTVNFNAEALAEAGVKRVVVQLVNERTLSHRDQIPALIAAGIEVEAYVYQWFSGGESFIRQRMNWALDELAAYPAVKRVWLDCEQGEGDDPPYGGGTETVEMIQAAVSMCGERGYEVGIYTAKWWMDRFLHEYDGFSYLPLWVAEYDGQQSLDFTPFNGWSKCEMKQYSGIGSLAGVAGIDMDWYEEKAMDGIQVTKAVDPATLFAVVKRAGDGLPDAESMNGGNFVGMALPGSTLVDTSTGQPIDIPAGKIIVVLVV
jgi:hypothetical protein